MQKIWKLQDAKAKFSQVVDRALKNGPQVVTRHGAKAVVVVSADDFEKLTAKKIPFTQFLLSCPKVSQDLDLERKKDLSRKVDL